MSAWESSVTCAFTAGQRTPEQYINWLYDRMEQRDPAINAFVDEPDRWERIHESLDAVQGRDLPLAGIPVGIKDIFHVGGMHTRAGTTIPSEVITGDEARVVSRLRDAGALILGKTVTAEFAYFQPGPTRNPHAHDHTPGGSSSGSAAAVAAGLCPIALGTQTAGSVIRPAAFCGTFGFKPSYERIPTDGVLPLAPSLDHVGWFMDDLSLGERVAPILYDRWDSVVPTHDPILGVPNEEYLHQASTTGIRAFSRQLEQLEANGFEIRQVPEALEHVQQINVQHHHLLAGEAAESHAEWYEQYRNQYSTILSDLIEEGRTISEEKLVTAREDQIRIKNTLSDVMRSSEIDLFVSPAAPGPAPEGLDSTGDPVMNVPWTFAGLPSMGIPAGSTTDGLPLGIQVTGRFDADEDLLAWGTTLSNALEG